MNLFLRFQHGIPETCSGEENEVIDLSVHIGNFKSMLLDVETRNIEGYVR